MGVKRKVAGRSVAAPTDLAGRVPCSIEAACQGPCASPHDPNPIHLPTHSIIPFTPNLDLSFTPPHFPPPHTFPPSQVAHELSRDAPCKMLRLADALSFSGGWRGGLVALDGVIERLRGLLPPTFEGMNFNVKTRPLILLPLMIQMMIAYDPLMIR